MTEPQGKLKHYLCLSGAMTLVGSSVVAGKIVALQMPIFLSSAIRFVLAVAVLWPLLRRSGGLPRMSRRDWGLLFLLALTGQFLFTICLLYGLKYTSALEAGIITSTSPAVIGLLAWLLVRERLSPAGLLALGLTVIGLMAVNLGRVDGTTGQARLWGNLLVFGAVVGESMFSIIRKFVAAPISPLGVATVISLMGLAMFLPPGLIEAFNWDWSRLTLAGALATVYFGLFVTALAYLLWFSGLAGVSSATAGTFTAVMPLSAVILSCLVLGEKLTGRHLLGGLAVVAGLLLMTLSKRRRN